MDAQAVVGCEPSPRRYSFEEHEALYKRYKADPALSPEEFLDLEKRGGRPQTDEIQPLSDAMSNLKNLEREAEQLESRADINRRKAKDLLKNLEEKGKPVGTTLAERRDTAKRMRVEIESVRKEVRELDGEAEELESRAVAIRGKAEELKEEL